MRRLSKETKRAIPLTDQAPTIFHYAKAMGYQTHYLDAQTNHLWNGLAVSDLAQVDHWLNTEQLGNDMESDFQAAEYIQHTITTSRGNFIVLNKRGVHIKYENAYPEDHAIWTPTPLNGNYQRYRDLIVNAYDNGLRYNVNTFFEVLFADQDAALENAIYIYTADHGETLFEDGTSWPHCRTTNKEAMVPLLIIGQLNQTVETNYKAHHSNIFATVLDLMDVPEVIRWYAYPPSLLSASAADSTDRLFLDSSYIITNFDE
jgi:glucan phosphoethanolaminetransferase (alkaline phosphatase superfamily)